jgi:hypothetical protein
MGGYQNELTKLKNKHKGERVFIVANGPSLQDINMNLLKNEITIGCNGIFSEFEKWGFHTTYYITEDVVQTELRAKEINDLKGPIKFAGIHNSKSFNLFTDMIFFYVPLRRDMGYYYELDTYPQFSRDFASIVHHGATVTYLMLELAFHLGFKEVYIIGLDHNYGKLPELFPPGKIEVTKENKHLVEMCHYNKNYYKIGDKIGVPWVEGQELAYQLADKIFNENNRKIFNASIFSKLNVFEKIDINDVLKKI